MTVRKVALDYSQLDPDLDAMRGGETLRANPVIETLNAADALLGHGRRILARVGLHGDSAWQVPDTAPAVLSQTHPERGVQRTVAQVPPIKLTPGHFLRAVLLSLPAGQTSAEDGVSFPWKAGGCEGSVDASITFDNGVDTDVVEVSMLVPPSTEDDGAQPQGAGAAWEALYAMRSALLMPAVVVDDASLAEWCEEVTAEITIFYESSPRVVDFVIYEEPYRYAIDNGTSRWAAPLNTTGDGKLLKKLPSGYPVEQAVAGVYGGGLLMLADAVERQRRIGPTLWYHTVWQEGFAPVDSLAPTALTTSATAFTELLAGEAGFDPDGDGVSVSSGANGRVFESSHDELVLRDDDNVVAVRCRIWAKVSNVAATGTVRFQTAEWSVVDVTVTGTSYAWHTATGHLRCGLGPQDPTILQLLGKVTATYTLSWLYVAVEFLDLA